MSIREEGKLQRRKDIVRAARTLMRDSGRAGFSMRALADEAGVSIATPYNLFGSKQAIMFAVLEADLEFYQARLAEIRADEIDVFFKAISLATHLYSREPSLYRSTLFAVYSDGGKEYRPMFSGSGHAMWPGLVADAIKAGQLSEAVEPNAFAVILSHILFSSIMEWVYDQIGLPEVEARTQYGFALTLLSMATPESRDRLQAKVLEQQKRLWEIWAERFGMTANPACES